MGNKRIEWTEEDTRSVEEYLKRIESGEEQAWPVPRSGDFKAWLASEHVFSIMFVGKESERRGLELLKGSDPQVAKNAADCYIVTEKQSEELHRAGVRFRIEGEVSLKRQ